jgi:hypothetical protein
MLISSKKRMPLPATGRNSGGSHFETAPSATGSPRRSVGASWLRRRSSNSSPWREASCATMLDFPIPGGPQIMTARWSFAERMAERVSSSWVGDIGMRVRQGGASLRRWMLVCYDYCKRTCDVAYACRNGSTAGIKSGSPPDVPRSSKPQLPNLSVTPTTLCAGLTITPRSGLFKPRSD